MTRYWDLHHVRISAVSEGEMADRVMLALEEDLPFLRLSEQKTSDIILHICEEPLPKTELFPKLSFTTMNVHGFGGFRAVNYGGQAVVSAVNTGDSRLFRISSQNFDDLFEASYDVLISALGEALDKKGFHRVHALGWEQGDHAGLLFVPPGGGKSSIAALLISKTAIKLFSDETPLLKAGTMHAFPCRMALRLGLAEKIDFAATSSRIFRRRHWPEKELFHIPQERVAEPRPVNVIVQGRITKGAPRIFPVGRWKILPGFFLNMVVGAGMIQKAEHMLRVGNLSALVFTAFSRLREMLHILKNSETRIFEMGPDARENFEIFKKFI